MIAATKGNHLYEFVRDLLYSSEYNPSHVRWEDKEIGVFRFVQSERVAKLWGNKKNNQNMTYEKLSRAMRYNPGCLIVVNYNYDALGSAKE